MQRRSATHTTEAEPAADCPLCPRLVDYRAANAAAYPDYRNAPAPSFGGADARLLIVGLAPGLHGANRTGRPFTGDYAGELLYATLLKFGFARGRYGAEPTDGLTLQRAMITNAVRCAPPQNKPTTDEIRICRGFLSARIAALPRLSAIVCLGRIAHDSTLAALGVKPKAAPFAHGAAHALARRAQKWEPVLREKARRNASPIVGGDALPAPDDHECALFLFDSYHCSRYNTNTGRLTTAMFEDVFRSVDAHLSGAAA